MPADSFSTSRGLVRISFRFLEVILSLVCVACLDKEAAAVFLFPGLCAITKLKCSTKLHAFHMCGGIIFVWKNFNFHSVSVMMTIGLVDLQRRFPNSPKANYIAWNFLAYFDILIWDEIKVFERYATCAEVFVVEMWYWVGWSLERTA